MNKFFPVIKKPDISLFWFTFLISFAGLPMLLFGLSYEKMAWTLTLVLTLFCIWFVFWKKQYDFEYQNIKFSKGLMNLSRYRLVSAVSCGKIDNLLEHMTNRKKYRVTSIRSGFGLYSLNLQKSSRLYSYNFYTVKGQAMENFTP